MNSPASATHPREGTPPRAELLERLTAPRPLVTCELRPPRSDLSHRASIDTWIDMHHAIRRLTAQDTVVFLTDNAVGAQEEENLHHLVSNLGEEHQSRLVPFLTSKHTLEYCLMYAARAVTHGYQALTVLGGDRDVGPPRCVDHAYELRQLIRERYPQLALGGWANPHRDPSRQVDFLLDPGFTAEFFLTQVVSHHDLKAVEAFVEEARRREVPYPGIFGVFYYRSASPKTLKRLAKFMPVPVEGLMADFASGLSPAEVCAKTILALREVGVDKVYVSNLGERLAPGRLKKLLAEVE